MAIIAVPVNVPDGEHLVAVIPVTRDPEDNFTAEHLQIVEVPFEEIAGVLKVLADLLELDSITQEFDIHTRPDPDVDMVIAASDKLAGTLGGD